MFLNRYLQRAQIFTQREGLRVYVCMHAGNDVNDSWEWY